MSSANLVIIRAHVAHLRRVNRRPTSIQAREWALLRLDRAAGGRSLLELDLETLRAWAFRAGLGIEARANNVSHLRAFYRWCIAEGLCDRDPSARLERPHRPRGLPRPMRDEHVARALRDAPEPIHAWLMLAAYAGLRACEIASLAGEDVLLDQRVIVIREAKGGDMQTVPLARALLPVVLAHPRRGYWFPSGPRGSLPHVTAGQVSKRASAWLREQGIPSTLHSLRHWFATKTYAATRDLRATQELLRHRSSATTDRYTWVDPGARASILDALPDLDGAA